MPASNNLLAACARHSQSTKPLQLFHGLATVTLRQEAAVRGTKHMSVGRRTHGQNRFLGETTRSESYCSCLRAATRVYLLPCRWSAPVVGLTRSRHEAAPGRPSEGICKKDTLGFRHQSCPFTRASLRVPTVRNKFQIGSPFSARKRYV